MASFPQAPSPWLNLSPEDQLVAQQMMAQGVDPFAQMPDQGQPPLALPQMSLEDLQMAQATAALPPQQPPVAEASQVSSGPNLMSKDNYSELMSRINDKGLNSLKQQGTDIEALRKRLAGLDATPVETDLSPLAALVDTWTGSNMAGSFRPSETKQSRQEMRQKLEDAIMRGNQGMAENEISFMRSQLNDELQKDNLSYRKMKDAEDAKLKREQMKMLADANKTKADNKFTPAQEVIDKEFGKTYNSLVTNGGLATVDSQIANLDRIKARIESGELNNISGPKVGGTPEALRKVAFPESVAAQQEIEQSVQSTMKETLGAQFTEREGQQILKRTFDPLLPPAENARRLSRVIDGLKYARDAKVKAIQYYEANGGRTIAGYKDDSIGKFQEFIKDLDSPKPAITPEQAKAELAKRGAK